jgi:MFS family permease
LSRDVRLFLASAALMGLCWKGIYGVLFNLYLLRLGYDPRQIGIANAVPTFIYGIGCVPAGILGGRWGARKSMIVGVVLVAIGLALPPCAQWLPASCQYAYIIASYSIAWCGASFAIVNGSPFLMGATGRAERDHAFSLQVAVWPLAGFFGSLIGGFLPEFFSRVAGQAPDSAGAYRYALFCAAIAYIPALPLLVATQYQEPVGGDDDQPDEADVPWGRLLFVGVVTLLCVAGDGVTRAFYNVYMDVALGLSTPTIGSIYAIGLVAGAFAAATAPLLMGRWGRIRTFIVASIGMSLFLLPLALVPKASVAAAAVIAMSALPLLARPVLTIYQMDLITQQWHAAMSAAGTMGRALSWSLASLLGGYLITVAGYAGAFLAAALVTLGGTLLFWARHPRKTP